MIERPRGIICRSSRCWPSPFADPAVRGLAHYRRRAGPRCSSAARARRGSDPTARARTGRGSGAVAGVAEILRRSDLAPAALARAAAQERELAAEARHHDIGRVPLLAALVGPLAGLQRALEVVRAALAQVALGDAGQVLIEDHHPPLGPLARLARRAVLPALAGGDRKMHDLQVALRVAHLGVAAEMAHLDHLVDATGHRLPAFLPARDHHLALPVLHSSH